MTPNRLARVLSNQTSQARKVFAALQANEFMTIQQIRATLLARNCQMAHNVIEGCLHSLSRVGLVDTSGSRFRAAFDTSKQPHSARDTTQEATDMNSSLAVTLHHSAVITIGAASKPAKTAEPVEPSTSTSLQEATNRIAAIGSEVVALVDEVSHKLNRLTSLGSELDDLAIQIALETDHVNEQIEKLAKVQTLLRDLGVAA